MSVASNAPTEASLATVQVEIANIELSVPEHLDENDLNEWIWANYQDEIRKAIVFLPSREESKTAGKKEAMTDALSLRHLVRLSNEVRGPMSCIAGVAASLRDTRLDQFQKRSVEVILDTSEQLVKTVDNVLEYSELESIGSSSKICLTNLQEIIDNVLLSSKKKAQDSNVRLETVLDDACVPEFISSDPRQLQKILSELVGNAVKFAKENTTVDLMVRLHVETNPDNEDNTYSLQIRVKSCNDGIHKKDHRRIFEPFQIAYADMEDYDGMGLGLAIASKLATSLGGKLSVDSSIGEWTEFLLEVPLGRKKCDAHEFVDRLKAATVLVINVDSYEEKIIPVFKRFGLNVIKRKSFKESDMFLGNLDRRRIHLCLAQEDLYSPAGYQKLSKVASSALLTFGSKRHLIKESKCHFRSLTETLPSIILESLVRCKDLTPRRSRPQAPRRALSEMQPRFDFEGIKVLIAEDQIINSKVLHRMLRRLGMTDITIVDNGQKAVDATYHNDYDIVFMDNQMPILDGVDAARLILQRSDRDVLPEIIFVTADTSKAFQKIAREAGGNGFISKPFNVRTIESYFQTQTRLRKPRRPKSKSFC